MYEKKTEIKKIRKRVFAIYVKQTLVLYILTRCHFIHGCVYHIVTPTYISYSYIFQYSMEFSKTTILNIVILLKCISFSSVISDFYKCYKAVKTITII